MTIFIQPSTIQQVDENESHNFDLFSSASTSMKWKWKSASEMLSHSERKHVGLNCENFHGVEIKYYIACLTYINRKQSEGEPQPKNKRLHFSAYQDWIVVKKINEAECRHVASEFPLRVKGSPDLIWCPVNYCRLFIASKVSCSSPPVSACLHCKINSAWMSLLKHKAHNFRLQFGGTVIEVFPSRKAFSNSNSTHNVLPPARSILFPAAKFIQHLCPEVKHVRPQKPRKCKNEFDSILLSSIRNWSWQSSACEATKVWSANRFPFCVFQEWKASTQKFRIEAKERKIGNSNDKLNFHTRLAAESAAVGDAFHLNSIFVNLPMLSLWEFFCLCAAGEIT